MAPATLPPLAIVTETTWKGWDITVENRYGMLVAEAHRINRTPLVFTAWCKSEALKGIVKAINAEERRV